MTTTISRQVKTIGQLVSELSINPKVNRPCEHLGIDATSDGGGILSL